MVDKPNFPAIPAPVADINSLHRTVEALRIAVEMLTRQRGTEASWPLLVGEARFLGIMTDFDVLPHKPESRG